MSDNIYADLKSDPPYRWASHANLGPSFFTPEQAAFRTAGQGYDADNAQYGDRQGHHAMHLISHNSYDGTTTVGQLEPCESGWLDAGGDTGRVTPAGRPW